jgi:tetratricopeptide (TPR) repeat protein
MNELVKRVFDWLDRYWHKKLAAVLGPLIAFLAVLWVFYSPQSNQVSIVGWIASATVCVAVLVAWLATNRLPRVAAGNCGIILGIRCDDPTEDKQVQLDFVGNLRQLLQQGGNRFELVELPAWSLEKIDSQEIRDRLFAKTRGHFLLYGRVRLRNKDGKPVHILSFEGLVRHRPVPAEVSQELSLDFQRVLPRRVIIDKENDAFSFEATAEWTDVSTRYLVGTAALISGDVAYAESLFNSVDQKLKNSQIALEPVKEISRRLPQRFRQMYSAWLRHLYDAYFLTRNKQFLVRSDEVSSKLLSYEPANRHAMNAKAICEFVLRRNVSTAHKLITKCRNDADATWWYSRAFLHAYQGKMDEALSDYKRAFRGPIPDKSVPIQCEDFIHSVLKDEPDRIQLHFCLGLINYHAKEDYAVATEDFERFLALVKDGEFKRLVAEARGLIADCKKRFVSNSSG